jgi:hypothetical protein
LRDLRRASVGLPLTARRRLQQFQLLSSALTLMSVVKGRATTTLPLPRERQILFRVGVHRAGNEDFGRRLIILLFAGWIRASTVCSSGASHVLRRASTLIGHQLIDWGSPPLASTAGAVHAMFKFVGHSLVRTHLLEHQDIRTATRCFRCSRFCEGPTLLHSRHGWPLCSAALSRQAPTPLRSRRA